jgi:hypothetical protein
MGGSPKLNLFCVSIFLKVQDFEEGAGHTWFWLSAVTSDECFASDVHWGLATGSVLNCHWNTVCLLI